jgi:hypothetical protein
MARFKARDLRDGTGLDEIRRTLNEIQKELAADLAQALSRSRVTELIIDGPYAARYGDVVRVAPPAAGLRVILPPKNLEQPGARVVLVVEGDAEKAGSLSVEAVDATVNGEDVVTYLAGVGTVEFQLTPTGWYGWSASLHTVPLGSLDFISADAFVGNVTAGSAAPGEVGLSTLAGAGLAFASHTLNVTGSTSITVTSDEVRRAALTGDVTAPANSNATTIANDAVTNAKAANMAARTVKLRADSAGTGDPTDGTGAQLGEIFRLATIATDNTSTGTVVTYALSEAVNVVRFVAGIAATTIRGATIPSEAGKIVIFENRNDTGVNVTFTNEDGAAASASERFQLQGGVSLVLAPSNRATMCYIASRWRTIGLG